MPIYALKTAAAWLADATPNGAVFADVADPATISGLTNGTPYQAAEILMSPLSAEFTPVAAPVAPTFVDNFILPSLLAGEEGAITGLVLDNDDYILAVMGIGAVAGMVPTVTGPMTVTQIIPAAHVSTTAAVNWYRVTGTGQVNYAPTVQQSFGGRVSVFNANGAGALVTSGAQTVSNTNPLTVNLTGLASGQFAMAAVVDRQTGGEATDLAWTGVTGVSRIFTGGSDNMAVAQDLTTGTSLNVTATSAAFSSGVQVLSVIVLGDA